MSMNVLKSEDFNSVGAIGSNFATRTGTAFAGRVIGPGWLSSAAPGWSAVVQPSAGTGQFDLTASPGNGANPRGAIGGWWNFTRPPAGAGNARFLWMDRASASQILPAYSINTAGVIHTEDGGWTGGNNPITVNYNQWYFFLLAWFYTAAGNIYDYRYYYRTLAGALTLIQSYDDLGGNSAPGEACFGNQSDSGVYWGGRMGGLRLWNFAQSDFSDIAYDSSLIAPVVERHTFSATASGLTSNTGLVGSEWPLDFDFLSNEILSGSVLPVNTGTDTGDILQIDTSGGDLIASGTQGQWNCKGFKAKPAPGQTYWRVDFGKTLGAVWSKTAGLTNIYETTDGTAGDRDGSIVWENDVPPGKLSRSDYASEALLLAAMDAKPSGELWCYPTVGGTKLYVKASGNGNPNSNGKTYTRSLARAGALYGASGIVVNVADVTIEGIWGQKTCLAQSSATPANDNLPGIAYIIQFDALSKNCRLANSYMKYWGKHAYGWTTQQSNGTFIDENNQFEQGTCYAAFGGQTGVAYYGDNGATNNTVRCTRPKNLKNAMLPNSLFGQVTALYVSMLCHGDANVFVDVVGSIGISILDANLCQPIRFFGNTVQGFDVSHQTVGRARLVGNARAA